MSLRCIGSWLLAIRRSVPSSLNEPSGSPEEPKWLTADAVIAINAFEVAATGEPFAVLDRGKLDGALTRPLNLFLYDGENDILTLAVSLLMAIAKAHAFAQGNERTAFFSMGAFLRANGYDIGIPDRTAFGVIVTAAVTGEMAPQDLEAVLESYVVPVAGNGQRSTEA
jgi:death-on-curing protein